MKTVSVGTRNNRNMWMVAVIAGLGALYFYRRRGGHVSDLVRRGYDTVLSAREGISRMTASEQGIAESAPAPI